MEKNARDLVYFERMTKKRKNIVQILGSILAILSFLPLIIVINSMGGLNKETNLIIIAMCVPLIVIILVDNIVKKKMEIKIKKLNEEKENLCQHIETCCVCGANGLEKSEKLEEVGIGTQL